MNSKLYAAIDIGTNAGRLLIGRVSDNGSSVQQIQLVRAPLRLGEDVFDTGKISDLKLKKFVYTLKSFKLLTKAYGINNFKACATSAMREAKNRDEVLAKIQKEANIKLEVIDGKREADLIFKSFNAKEFEDHSPHLFIDVGGGSTELTIFDDDSGRISQSFEIGTVRMLKNKVETRVWDQITKWLNENTKNDENYSAIGTGGNINKISQMARKYYLEPISFGELHDTYDYLNSMSYEQRVDQLRMNTDRADVIVPAAEIYIEIMRLGNIEKIFVPKMGVADGMILEQYFEDNLYK